ncbi:MAG: tRNA (adenosine(37)-N6)-threonylcarbamoyltransferase complex ATPase subunit type 1 TsaE [Bacteroidia bacterium]
MQKHFRCDSEDDLYTVVDEIIKESSSIKIFAFFGEMGAGKTTLIKKICEKLHVQSHVSSPTFSLVNEYETNTGEIVYHFDFYRIKSLSEAVDIGFDEYLYSGNLCLIEWAENVHQLLPEETINIKIIPENNTRNITMSL